MSGGPLVAGVDIGTTSVKVGLWTQAADAVHLARYPTPRGRDSAGTQCLDVDGLIALVHGALRDAAEATGRIPSAVGVASMAETGVPLDSKLRPLAPAMLWTDQRAAADLDQLVRRWGREQLHARTGLRAHPKHTLATWLWMRREQPQLLAGAAVWAGIADVVAASLTGRLGTAASLAGRTLAYDVTMGAWDADLLAEAGLREHQVPPVVDASAPVGTVHWPAAAAAGLIPGTPVVVAGHDHVVGAWAAGVRAPGSVADSAGTAEMVLAPVHARTPAPALLDAGYSFGMHADGRTRYVNGGLSSSGALLEWFLDLFPDDAAGRYDRVPSLLAGLGERPEDALALPYLAGRAAPAPDPRRGLTVQAPAGRPDAGALLRALLEGAALHVRWMLERLAAVAGVSVRQVVAFGGCLQLPGWAEMKAAVGPWPLRRARDAELVSLGAAQLAAPAAGLSVQPAVLLRAHADPDAARSYAVHYTERWLPLATRT